MAGTQINLLQEQLTFCRDETLRIAGNVPESHWLKQLVDGKAHPMWLIGHLTNTVNTVVVRWTLGERLEMPKGFGRRFAPDFAGGLPITGNAEDYPEWDEVVSLYRLVMTTAIDGIGKLADDELPNPLPGEVPDQLRGFFSSIGRSLSIMVSHDSYHRGQIGMLSKLPQ